MNYSTMLKELYEFYTDVEQAPLINDLNHGQLHILVHDISFRRIGENANPIVNVP